MNEMKPVNAELKNFLVVGPIVEMTFQIKKEDLTGLNFSRPEFVLVITPAEKLFEQ